MHFKDARHTARLSIPQVAEYLDLSIRTIKRYESTGKAPKSVIECLLMIGGHCPSFSLKNDFSGWYFGSGFIYSPEGDKFTSGDIRAGKIALLEMNRLHRFSQRRKKARTLNNKTNVISFSDYYDQHQI